jgi:uncharacterized protein YodC (DUF2158 family)
MADTFKIGDVVQLKSGGPKMTVVAIGELVRCAWFFGDNSKQEASAFPAGALEAVTESPAPLQTRANTSRPRQN